MCWMDRIKSEILKEVQKARKTNERVKVVESINK